MIKYPLCHGHHEEDHPGCRAEDVDWINIECLTCRSTVYKCIECGEVFMEREQRIAHMATEHVPYHLHQYSGGNRGNECII